MSERRKQIRYNIYAFFFLFSISLYRQISMRYLPDDPFRTYVLYAGYVLLIAGWGISIWLRVTQKSMCIFLFLEAGVMFFGLTIRFLQDTFWYQNIRLMRVSGLYIAATLLPMILFGLYASLGTGQADTFRIPGKWYGLLVLVLILTVLIVEDERLHFVFYIIPEEPQPNLNFHPYTGTFLMTGFGFALLVIRVMQIYKRNKVIHKQKLLSILIPCFEPTLILIFSLEYFVVSLQIIPSLAGKEVIELYAGYYYIEALMWEFYIYMGLVPVNTGYREIFERATVGMQILGENDKIVSENAVPVSGELLNELKNAAYIRTEPGKELHMHRFSDAYLLWNKDVTLIQNTIHGLNANADALVQEGELLEKELKTKNEEARLQAKNRIYDELTGEVAGQLQVMKELIKKRDPQRSGDEDLRRLYLLGTYVKRRCNLRLIQKETGSIDMDDLRLSFENMAAALEMMNIPTELCWNMTRRFSTDFSLYMFDTLENILEHELFSSIGIGITVDQNGICYDVKRAPDSRAETGYPSDAGKYAVVLQETAEGFRVTLLEGGESYVSEL